MITTTSKPIEYKDDAPESAESNLIFAEFNTGESYPLPRDSISISDLILDAEENLDF